MIIMKLQTEPFHESDFEHIVLICCCQDSQKKGDCIFVKTKRSVTPWGFILYIMKLYLLPSGFLLIIELKEGPFRFKVYFYKT
jgi:hypothetical protein